MDFLFHFHDSQYPLMNISPLFEEPSFAPEANEIREPWADHAIDHWTFLPAHQPNSEDRAADSKQPWG